MTDCPTNEMDLMGVPDKHRQPHTVILMLPDDMRSDEACAADWIRRVWVYGSDQESMIEQARDTMAEIFEWDEEDAEERKETLEPIAVFPGHHFDIYQP